MPETFGPTRLGERIERRRRQRGLSRRVVADLVGRSEEWLRQVERGIRQLDSLEAILRLAEVLHIPNLADFIDWPFQGYSDRANSAVDKLRLAVIDHNAVDAFGTRSPGVLPILTWDCLDVELADSWDRWSRSSRRYTESIARVPDLLLASRSLSRQDQASARAGQLTSGPYRLARLLLTRLGDHQLAWHAAQRALELSYQAGHHTATIASAWHVAVSLFHLGRYAEARQYAQAAALKIASVRNPVEAAQWGALQLLAAESAAADHDEDDAAHLLSVASEAAEHLGTDQGSYCLWFGPTEVAITSIHVALRLGRTNEALCMARCTEIPATYPVGRQARHYIGLALGYSRRGDDAAAVLALIQAEHVCPEDLRYDATARRVLHHLIRRNNRSLGAELTRLSSVAGLE